MKNGTSMLTARVLVAIIAGLTLVKLGATTAEAGGGEVLYNGIRLPEQWPPRLEKLDRDVMPVPYLKHPPEVIPIDVGRQLLVDDFLVERTTLKRTFHRSEYHAASPVLKAESPADKLGARPTAMVFSDGVWYDPADKLFKMWYMGGYCVATCYAESKDGVHWKKPLLDVEPGTNVVLSGHRDSSVVWLDHQETDPKRRFKMFCSMPTPTEGKRAAWHQWLHFSPDGIHWSEPAARSPQVEDARCTVFYNPFRKVWVHSIRIHLSGLGRMFPLEGPGVTRCKSRWFNEFCCGRGVSF